MGYWKDGQFVAGQTVRTAGTCGVGTLELEVAAAVARPWPCVKAAAGLWEPAKKAMSAQ